MLAKLVILGLALLARSLLAQESALIISQPRLSVKTFTNWQLIKLTYTISYLSNYDFLEEEAKPENMSFGPLELDQILGKKQIIANWRNVGSQISLDLIYYLRHVGEKKGELVISEQTFRYIKLMPGKTKEGQEVFEARSEPIILRYDSVLTKDADDIMDEIDLGSFQHRARLWKYGALAGFLVGLGIMLVATFRNPFRKKMLDGEMASGQEAVSEKEDRRLVPQEAFELFNRRLNEIKVLALAGSDAQSGFSARAELSNELRNLLLSYVPRLLPSDTIAEIRTKIATMKPSRASEALTCLTNWLEHNEDILYGLKAENSIDADIGTIKTIGSNLSRLRLILFDLEERGCRLRNRAVTVWAKIPLISRRHK